MTPKTPSSSQTDSQSPATLDSSSRLSTSQVRLLLFYAFIIATCTKVLLWPAYYSTDFFVHRHWKAVTRSLSIKDWYFDDDHVETVHTLDYPPGFAWFEAILARNPLTIALLENNLVETDCLKLRPDVETGSFTNKEAQLISYRCVAFMRSTVIVSDIILWLGAAWAVTVATRSTFSFRTVVAFLLIVLHPVLLWLDHVHFQYNGMIYGVLLASLGCLIKGNNIDNNNNDDENKDKSNDKYATNKSFWSRHSSILCHLGAAVLFALLLTLKHLFLVLVPWYCAYLFRRFAFVDSATTITITTKQNYRTARFSIERLGLLATITLATLALPFVPFLLHDSPTRFIPQLLRRLFPFQRGLVHDYWAGNIWAIYVSLVKTIRYISKGSLSLPSDLAPKHVAILLLLGLLPGAYNGWKAGATKDNNLMLMSLAQSSLTSFTLGYHVHEKAILTTLIPMIIWVSIDKNENDGHVQKLSISYQTTCYGLLGLFPLLFLSSELLLKVFSCTAYLILLKSMAATQKKTTNKTNLNTTESAYLPYNIYIFLKSVVNQGFPYIYVIVIVILECIPMKAWQRFSFLPLALTSLVVAGGLTFTWIETTVLMMMKTSSGSTRAGTQTETASLATKKKKVN